METSIPWVEKYRPNVYENIILHKHNKTIFDNILLEGSFPHMLLYGPPGTGKIYKRIANFTLLEGSACLGNYCFTLSLSIVNMYVCGNTGKTVIAANEASEPPYPSSSSKWKEAWTKCQSLCSI